ncbi:hypothetical protein D910_00136 [Dendroctonus ponderosae]|uniref:Laminin EGF-like domain-containing protein n=1 Tax=Dendroctonus ponderosae TaxID=77166 RepID=U4URH1_DENPD|nr:hypothetical protein D910_00136 [Dendroctonus ponderosae]
MFPGYVGQFCESCAPGFRHSPAHGGPFTNCIPCDCNSHARICDSETGRCICEDHTTGENCERCSRGYYGNALADEFYFASKIFVFIQGLRVCLEEWRSLKCPPREPLHIPNSLGMSIRDSFIY